MDEIQAITSSFRNATGQKQIMKAGQLRIFEEIALRLHPRNAILAHTRYGKSMTIAQAVLHRATRYPESWVFVGPTKLQADILMRHLIQHLFDDNRYISQLEVDVPLDRLRRERKKDSLTFRRGGRIFTLSADARNTKRIGSVLGQGSPNVILDEAPLIPDKIESMISRMLADSADNYFVKIGNAFENNHFKRAFSDSKYNKIVIDCYQGLEESKSLPYNEGRLTQEIIDEAKTKPFFEQLWECKFATIGLVDERGFSALLAEDSIIAAMNRKVEPKGSPRLGVDVGRGGDPTVYVLRWDNYAKRLESNTDSDLMAQVGRIKKYREDFKIEDRDIFIDDIGVGGGVTDRLRESNINATAVVAGSTPRDTDRFKNIKAEASWEAKLWIEDKNNALEPLDEFKQLVEIRYKEDSSRKLFIEPKEDLRKRIGRSPDDADALILTFAPQETVPEIMVL